MPQKLFSSLLSALLGLAASMSAHLSPCAAQPLIRQAHDISLIGTPALPGILAVTLHKGQSRTVRFLDLEQHKVLEFPSPVPNPGYPSFSPGGDSVTFAGTTRRGPEIFTSSWAGENVQRITFNTVEDGNPAWSPDGHEVIYFSENQNYKSEIFSTLTSAPFTRTQLTKVGGGNTTPHISPDERHLLYTTDRYAPAWNICVIDRTTGVEWCPLRPGNTSNCRANWSPDGSKFVFTLERGENVDLYLYTLATRVSERLTSLPHKEYDATWSPDGNHIAFAHNPTGRLTYTIKVVRLSDRAIIPIAKASGSLRYLSWSTGRPYTVAADLCPGDQTKTKPGLCGCGAADTDTDNDSVPDCIDGCPLNRKKHRAPSCD